MDSTDEAEDTVTVIHMTDDECIDQCPGSFDCQSTMNRSQLAKLVKISTRQTSDMSSKRHPVIDQDTKASDLIGYRDVAATHSD